MQRNLPYVAMAVKDDGLYVFPGCAVVVSCARVWVEQADHVLQKLSHGDYCLEEGPQALPRARPFTVRIFDCF